ncbi:hypothetical protein J7S20_01600 [Sphingomonadaceae bacterium LXI357]|uniref:Uncharacterized protein n=1 Tax=Stakelama marina TaxID=2826939 RepID=A0A8T4IBI7_9SPHN|nr:hypothetical protein [Stakelama marina]
MTGKLRDVDTLTGDHLVCHCSDCLAFVRFCDPDRVPAVIDGVQLFQTRVSRMAITLGKELIACVHLTDKPMLRWYSKCCRTPLFHTVHSGWYPFVTIHVAILDYDRRAAAIGEPRGHTFVSNVPAALRNFREVSRFGIMARFTVRMWNDLVSGDFRRAELFEPASLKPIVEPRRLTISERAELDAQTAG